MNKISILLILTLLFFSCGQGNKKENRNSEQIEINEKVSFWNNQQKGTNFFNEKPTTEWFDAANAANIKFIRFTYEKWQGEQRDFLLGNADDYQGIIELKAFMNKNKLIWIKAGYFVFGRKGPNGINIELLAKKIKKSKSSFYHYFGDLETFQEELLAYHLERADQIAAKGRACKNMDPDVINLLVATKDDLLFNKQLRLNVQNPDFKKCLEQSSKKINDSFLNKWNIAVGFEQNPMLGEVILYLLRDNFFLQVTDENLTYEWFRDYLKNLFSIIQQIQVAYRK